MEKWPQVLGIRKCPDREKVLGREASSILFFRLSNTSTDFASDRKKYLLWLKVKPHNVKCQYYLQTRRTGSWVNEVTTFND